MLFGGSCAGEGEQTDHEGKSEATERLPSGQLLMLGNLRKWQKYKGYKGFCRLPDNRLANKIFFS